MQLLMKILNSIGVDQVPVEYILKYAFVMTTNHWFSQRIFQPILHLARVAQFAYDNVM